MSYNIRIVSTYPPRRCGIGTFSRDLASALEHFTAEIGYIRVAAINNNSGPYGIPVDLIIDQYTPQSWADTIQHIIPVQAKVKILRLFYCSMNTGLIRIRMEMMPRGLIMLTWQKFFRRMD